MDFKLAYGSRLDQIAASPNTIVVPDPSPILNNPYDEPRLHYETNPEGEIDYEKIVESRRIFSPTQGPMPTRQGAQRELLPGEQIANNDEQHLINLMRREVAAWREGADASASYAGVTRVTGDLLRFWFANPDRDASRSLFFAQREAIECAIWLNEAAEKSNAGQHILSELRRAQQTVSADPVCQLPRIAFKLATGAGKTVVMGALILYHYLNRQEYANNPRFADSFLLVAPGVTIRDRLGVLRYDERGGIEAQDYYSQRWLVPENYKSKMGALNSRIAITNYHAFEPKVLSGNKKGCFDGKPGSDGKKKQALEDYGIVLKRLLPNVRPGSRLIVFNDEAHHCYLPRGKGERNEEGDTEEENKRAAVWFTGMRELASRYKVNVIYDLSATPYYLRGSGYDPYSLFPWIVSDFGLIEAIESGLVKIPLLPETDTSQVLTVPVLRNLYDHVREELPRAGRATLRARAREQGTEFVEEAPNLPLLVKTALAQFYEHYETAFKGRAGEQLAFESAPPVFIVVCNNVSVSREVFKVIGGFELPSKTEGEPPIVYPGTLPLFNNFDPGTLQPLKRPPTLLIDSDALENSGQINDDFKRVFASEVAAFKRDYARVHGQGAAENITDVEILREVVNTVGKRNALGSHVRCVVSVSMLTEGWDANTVTHIMGLRAFGSQLLCEQVAGRALRRISYKLKPYDPKTGEELDAKQAKTRSEKNVVWKFPPEYAQIIGVPFMPFRGGGGDTEPPEEQIKIHALEEREEAMEITFPNVLGYRVEHPEGELRHDFTGVPLFDLDFTKIPQETELGCAFGPQKETLTFAQVMAMREQEIIYNITRCLIATQFTDNDGNREFQRFADLKAIVTHWYHHGIRLLGSNNPEHRKVIYFADPLQVCNRIKQGINPQHNTEEHIRPILNHYVRTGSTRFVHGLTSREVYPTQASHVNYVVADTESWEQRAAKVCEDLAKEGIITAYVKNAFLGFRIPYQKATGEPGRYEPDFIIKAKGGTTGEDIRIILEITGFNQDKQDKRWTVRNRWLPSVNAVAPHYGWPRWEFIETDTEDGLKNLKPTLTDLIHSL